MNDRFNDVKHQEITGNSPLHDAVAGEILVAVMNLLAAGADVHARNSAGETPLHYVRSYKIAQLLLEAGANVNVRDDDGFTPLHFAVLVRAGSVVQLFLQFGADVDAKTSSYEVTPLHFALGGIFSLNFNIIELLLNAGADVNAQNTKGQTPVHYFFSWIARRVSLKSYARILRVLLEFGADFSVKDNQGVAPLDYAQSLDSQLRNQIKKYLR